MFAGHFDEKKVPEMSTELLYLSSANLQDLQITPSEAREAIISAFRDNAAGRNIGLPKSIITINPYSWFISMSSASEGDSIAAVKWVAVIPVEGTQARSTVNGLVCVSDYNTGAPIAVLDGNSITLIRTAAMSTAAAIYLAPKTPATIGLIGCGLQAFSHLDSFVDLFPSLRRIYLLSRSVSSAERVATAASEKQLDPIIASGPEELLSQSEIVVSMVPGSPGLKPFLDARSLPSSAFACAVDGGRSWRPDTFAAFDRLVTDSLEQYTSPLDASGTLVDSVKFEDDLVHLASGSSRPHPPMRALFGFQGFGVADLALAGLAIRKARAFGVGAFLPR
ncbi:ornithine cyclodeaminase family protein [Sinorhizobium prairiense]|uniref:ornithine cyclodeaminase family protein n=1 Tax=unclassified Sinorhizobium TaxID=2613772 RepID=UPI0023D7C238|nr:MULTISPECIES: ornithine cyclodeaminase family protein [unclassified Sinorhizobium]WEJ08766.1 ornithine cyclodeaminase family protein [Sinorhizobium sp. M103]WEJ14145.1 ornithine cyclodeaminase family protein [Sinorhizobium sp. K101]WEJ35741.1 ornithine cyclodeaminase family protein [Sinorhizobium sp. C101]